MRPLTRVDSPPFFPRVCISCGIGAGPERRFFIDLGFDIAGIYNPMNEGSVYLCDVCAPSWVDGILNILADDRAKVMDNNQQKEEATYGYMGRITGGPELSDVRSGESVDSLSGTTGSRGTLSVLDQGENLPDAGERSSAPPVSELSDTTAGVTDATRNKPASSERPTFRMGARINPEA